MPRVQATRVRQSGAGKQGNDSALSLGAVRCEMFIRPGRRALRRGFGSQFYLLRFPSRTRDIGLRRRGSLRSGPPGRSLR